MPAMVTGWIAVGVDVMAGAGCRISITTRDVSGVNLPAGFRGNRDRDRSAICLVEVFTRQIVEIQHQTVGLLEQRRVVAQGSRSNNVETGLIAVSARFTWLIDSKFVPAFFSPSLLEAGTTTAPSCDRITGVEVAEAVGTCPLLAR